MAYNKADAYDQLQEIIEEEGSDFLVKALADFYSTAELEELIEFLEDERNGF